MRKSIYLSEKKPETCHVIKFITRLEDDGYQFNHIVINALQVYESYLNLVESNSALELLVKGALENSLSTLNKKNNPSMFEMATHIHENDKRQEIDSKKNKANLVYDD